MASSKISISTICLLFFARVVSADFCKPNPCGPNTRCEISARGIPTCLCKETYYGQDPIKEGCKHECENDQGCKASKKCFEYQCVECNNHSDCTNKAKSTCFAHRCIDICKEVKCGVGAICETTATHQALCFCPPGSEGGDPSLKCF